jgi:hypothetical protein
VHLSHFRRSYRIREAEALFPALPPPTSYGTRWILRSHPQTNPWITIGCFVLSVWQLSLPSRRASPFSCPLIIALRVACIDELSLFHVLIISNDLLFYVKALDCVSSLLGRSNGQLLDDAELPMAHHVGRLSGYFHIKMCRSNCSTFRCRIW